VTLSDFSGKNLSTVFIALAISSGGVIITPKILPADWFAEDRFTGARWKLERRELRNEWQEDLNRFEHKVDMFAILGPKVVVENQKEIITLLAKNHNHSLDVIEDLRKALRETQKELTLITMQCGPH